MKHVLNKRVERVRKRLTWQTLVPAVRDEVVTALTQAVLTETVWHFERTLLVDGASKAQQRRRQTRRVVQLDVEWLTRARPGLPLAVGVWHEQQTLQRRLARRPDRHVARNRTQSSPVLGAGGAGQDQLLVTAEYITGELGGK